MSYEGYMQRWCPQGHYWKTHDVWMLLSFYPDGREQLKKDVLCPVCGERNAAWNEVDDTNCDAAGKCQIVDRLPTLVELSDSSKPTQTSASRGRFWHKSILDNEAWLDAIQAIENEEERTSMWAWAATG